MLDPKTFPRPPKLERIAKEILIRWPDGTPIASTSNAFWVLETYHPPTYYIPPSDVQVPLQKLSRQTYCEWKGSASYFSMTSPNGEKIDGRVWNYERPNPSFAEIKDYLCFYADERWNSYVDGEKVEPQPGDFYGGWMTKDIVRASVKGAPGTRGW
ncbi:DUF427-domain-containing protein [Myriangium duriaei CBS 260.36]|uniref:DUF427-domain-containing protein n=1 Tax=Myriangium duriaei CBS 260.36 TaxID=1168546 RepID=A0A9P4IVT6_9PEZI|nr:DUF427-domain-containing protein [Myriangium duriaei CBS 260.36]